MAAMATIKLQIAHPVDLERVAEVSASLETKPFVVYNKRQKCREGIVCRQTPYRHQNPC